LEDVYVPRNVSSIPEKIIKISAGGDFSMLLSNDGNVYSFGQNSNGQGCLSDPQLLIWPAKVAIFNRKIVEISTGQSFSMMLSSEGFLYGCGLNTVCHEFSHFFRMDKLAGIHTPTNTQAQFSFTSH
jgi:alpha-tubulin suppressor-like RCC1 family protein